MITFHLSRFCDSPMGVFGELAGTNGFFCVTCERPWVQNAKRISCIPTGTYQVVRERYNKGGYDALQLLNVPGRDEILIHAGNTIDDIQGCILVGSKLGVIGQRWAVLNSKPTLVKLLDSIDLLSNIELRISWRIPGDAVDPTGRV